MNKVIYGFGIVAISVFYTSMLVTLQNSRDVKGTTTSSVVKAFPEAEGFGANSIGGRGGRIYEVTNLNDSGEGSLRNCVIATGPRICIFKVGGTIVLKSQLTITNPYITIAGQTALGGGILLRKAIGSSGDLITSKTHDVIIRYISGRVGPTGEDHVTQMASTNSSSMYNIIFDHCSFSWATDSVWETWYRVYDSTIQWSFINEGLDFSTHGKTSATYGHSKGLMIGGYDFGGNNTGKGSYNISVHHNLMAHNAERAPLMQFCGNGQVINNVTYNPRWTFSHQEIKCADTSAVSVVNWIGNYHKKGPNSTSNTDYKVSVTGGTSIGKAYFKGNIGPGRSNNSLPETSGVSAAASLIATTPVDAPAVTTSDALTAYSQVLTDGGNSKGLDCNGNWYYRRDAVDKRNVEEVKSGGGRIIDAPSQSSCLGTYCKTYLTTADYTKYGISASEIGTDGWPVIAAGSACADYDRDGMPDSWENSHGLSLNNSGDNILDKDQDGYTNIEEYLNGTDPEFNGGVLVVTSVPTTVPTTKPTANPTITPVRTVTIMPTVTTIRPTITPTKVPTAKPTATPTKLLTTVPTKRPTNSPTRIPTSKPTSLTAKSSSDTSSPTIKIIYPSNNSRLDHDNKISVYGKATDNVKVTKIEYFIDGANICTFTNPSSITNCKTYVTKKTNYNYMIIVKAYDAANNMNTATSVVTTIH